MPIETLDMKLVHRVLRREFDAMPDLIGEVPAGDTAPATIVGDHLTFIVGALHHHHCAKDELVWPRLQARVPARAADIARMEAQHARIALAVQRVQAALAIWVDSPDLLAGERLLAAVAELGAQRRAAHPGAPHRR